MRSLRDRPSRGEISPAKNPKGSPTAARRGTNNSTPTSTPRSQRTSMAAAPGDAIEVRESIEAKGDVEMADADGAAPAGAASARRRVSDADADADDDVDADGDVDMDAEGEPDDDAEQPLQDQSSIDLVQRIKDISEYLCRYTVMVDGEEHEIASAFQRLVNKRSLPDYFEVIKEPMAFSTIRAKLGKKTYEDFNEFVRDVTRICHNAQVYNRPSSLIFSDASQLLQVFKAKLEELVKQAVITAEDAAIPDYGPLPEFEDSPPPEEDEQEDDEEEEEEEEEEESEGDSDDEGGRRRGRRSGYQSARRDRGGDDDDPHSKRGRPPKVLTPLEARISAIIKGLRRYRNREGQVGVSYFEKTPDKMDLQGNIAEAISLDTIKKKLKRKKYQTVDQMVRDMDVVFENVKASNKPGDLLYEDAVELQKLGHDLADEQKARPDDDFRDEDGRLPLASIAHNGREWKVGDWVHIRNANDLTKPIVAQIYRTWADASGRKWVNACWYYRPEQTVHRYDKHFWENEVFKTGRYKDHPIEDVEDQCFVMFITRYYRGRPLGLPADKAVYVCESRYNEEKHRFNKIKTWNSCLPDEVRDRDYEMTLFPAPRPQKKVPSPIKHLLQADAKETDEFPKPTWRGANAPPLIGAVHRRPREKNDSPPPEAPRALPPNLPVGLAMGASPRPPVGTPGMPGQYHHAAQVAPIPMASPHFQQFQVAPRQGPPPTPHGMGQVHIQPQPQGMPGMHVQQHPGMSQMPMVPMQQQMQPQMQPAPQFSPHPQAYNAHSQFVPQPQAPPQAHYQSPAHLAPAYDPHLRQIHPSPAATNSRPPMAPTPAHPLGSAPMPHPAVSSPNMYNPPRAPEVYTLTDDVDNAIPKHVKEQFQCDDKGRLLWFTSPPIFNQGRSSEVVGLSNTVTHIKDIKDVRADRRAKRLARDEAVAAERLREAEQTANAKRADNADKIALMKRRMLLNNSAARELQAQQEIQALINDPVALEKWARAFKEHMDEGTNAIYQDASYDWEPTPWPES